MCIFQPVWIESPGAPQSPMDAGMGPFSSLAIISPVYAPESVSTFFCYLPAIPCYNAGA